MTLNKKEISILHRAIKVFTIELLENERKGFAKGLDELDYPEALMSVTKKIKDEYELQKNKIQICHLDYLGW